MSTRIQTKWLGKLSSGLLLAGLLLSARPGQAQVDTYAFAASSGTYTPLPATATPVPTILADDAISAGLPIGFSFVFDGTPYTTFYASSNGFISFNSSAGSANFNDMTTGSSDQRPLVAPLWDDLGGGDPTSVASYQLTGTAPNRVLTFEWRNWRWRYTATAPGISFQTKLYEGTNRVEFVYRPEAGALSSPTASIGLVGAGTGSGSFLSVSDLIAAPTVSSSTESSSIAVLPVAGQTYAFTPPVPSLCPTPRNLAATAITATSATISYTVSNATPGPFTILYGPTGFNPALTPSSTNVYSTTTTTNSSLTLNGLAVQTGYQFYIVQNCGGTNGNSSISNAGSFTTRPTAPLNDDCAGAINVPIQFVTCVTQVSADNTAATSTAGAPAPACANYQGNDLWFKVTVPITGTVSIQTLPPTAGSNIADTGMSVYSGTCASLTELQCDDDSSPNGNYSQVDLANRTPGEVLYIRVWSYGNNTSGLIAVCVSSPSNCAMPTVPTTGAITDVSAVLNWVAPTSSTTGNTYEIEYGPQNFVQGLGTTITGIATTTTTRTITGLTPNTAYCFYVRQNCGTINGSSAWVGPTCFNTPLTVPANDEPCGALTLGAGTRTGTTLGSTTTVLSGIQFPVCSPSTQPKDVWFAFTPTGTTATFTMTGAPAGMVRVYSAPSCSAGPFTVVSCAASGANNTAFTAPISFTGLTAGQRYYLAVSGYGSSDTPGSFTIAAAGVVTAARAQADTEALLVYPNPSNTGQLTLKLSTGATGQATLLNALGQVVRTKSLTAAPEQTLDTHALAAGVYTLRVDANGQTFTRKVVLE